MNLTRFFFTFKINDKNISRLRCKTNPRQIHAESASVFTPNPRQYSRPIRAGIHAKAAPALTPHPRQYSRQIRGSIHAKSAPALTHLVLGTFAILETRKLPLKLWFSRNLHTRLLEEVSRWLLRSQLQLFVEPYIF